MRYSSLALLPLAAASPLTVGTIHNDAAPVVSSTTVDEVVPNSYIVVLKDDVKDAKKHHEWVQSVHVKAQDERSELRKRSQFPMSSELFEGLKHTYDIVGGMMGYSGHFDEETLEEIRRHPDVSTLFPRLRAPRVANRELPADASAGVPRRVAARPSRSRKFASGQLEGTQSNAIARDCVPWYLAS